jgi:hypothetical protein
MDCLLSLGSINMDVYISTSKPSMANTFHPRNTTLKLLGILVFVLLVSPVSYAQLCDFVTDGTGASAGIKMKISLPCNMQDDDKSGDTTLVKSVGRKQGGCYFMVKLRIRKLSTKYTNEQAMAKFTGDAIKGMYERVGGTVTNVVGLRQREDGKIKGFAEFNVKQEEGGTTFYTVHQHHIYYHRGSLITISYEIVSAGDEWRAKNEMGVTGAALLPHMLRLTTFLN